MLLSPKFSKIGQNIKQFHFLPLHWIWHTFSLVKLSLQRYIDIDIDIGIDMCSKLQSSEFHKKEFFKIVYLKVP